VKLAIYCADIGSVPKARFGWARGDTDEAGIERHRGGTEIIELVDAVAEDLAADRAVALGFECPLFVGVPTQPMRLGTARSGEGNRSWSGARRPRDDGRRGRHLVGPRAPVRFTPFLHGALVGRGPTTNRATS
jgi:hypothetical protein